MMKTEDLKPPIEVPPEAMGAETLQAVLESFVLREGTDYGLIEKTLAEKVSQIRKQLDRKEVKIVFDPNTETVTLMNTPDWNKLSLNV